MKRNFWSDQATALTAHPTTLPVIAAIMAATPPVLTLFYSLCLNTGHSLVLLDPYFWLWTGFYSALLMLRFGKHWPMPWRGILLICLPIDALMLLKFLLVSTMGGPMGVLLTLLATLTPFLPLGVLLSPLFG